MYRSLILILILMTQALYGAYELTLPNVPIKNDNEFCMTSRPIGIELTKNKMDRLIIKLNKIDTALDNPNFNYEYINGILNEIYALKLTMNYIDIVLENRLKACEKLFEQKKKTALCCTIL